MLQASHQAAKGDVVKSIQVYRRQNRNAVDAILMLYPDGQYDILGDADAVANGVLAAQLSLAETEQVKELYLIGNAQGGLLGLYITTTTLGNMLNALFGRNLNMATKYAPADLGSGILLGAAVAVDTSQDMLTAAAFIFLAVPHSTAFAVDMPAIDLASARVDVKLSLRSATTVMGVTGATATCPEFKANVTEQHSYGTNLAARRYSRLSSLLGEALAGSDVKQGASLSWMGPGSLAGKDVSFGWSGEVMDIFSASSLAGYRMITSPLTSFPVPKDTKTTCHFVYSTIQVSAPYTATAVFAFLADTGLSTWRIDTSGVYLGASSTELNTVIWTQPLTEQLGVLTGPAICM